MIIGIGVDVTDVSRFEAKLRKTPKLTSRLFTPGEQDLPIRSLAARFAAKEALIKALGGSDGISWQDIEILRDSGSRPVFSKTIALNAVLNTLGAAHPHLSITHDGNVASAFVIVESDRLGK